MKKILTIILAVILLTGGVPGMFASASAGARLYNVYSDGMIFEQNEDAIFAGSAAPGSVIRAVLKSSAGRTVARGESTAAGDGRFSVSFPSPAGSFSEYDVELSADGAVFATLSHVVFGEVWLAAGQSNMSYPYIQAEDYVSPAESQTEKKRFIRLFWCPEMVEYKGDATKLAGTPQVEIPGCAWFDANDQRSDGFSAVAYFFALDLAEKLDVPVGIVSVPLGGSSILSWLPREAVEGSEAITNRAKTNGQYYTLQDWQEQGVGPGQPGPSDFVTMTALYNKKISPVRNFRYSGMLWYQGESDIFWTDAEYAEAFDLMQDSYTALFGRDSDLPVIWTQLASYNYGSNELNTLRNIAFADMQQSRPGSRALVTAYDYPSTYNEAGAIHPMTKKPLGERMSFAAQRLVYGEDGDHTMPTVESYEISGGGISVKFRDVGDGLVCDGSYLRGFTIAGKNGVYVRADAEITGRDTIFIHDLDVTEPASAAYAFSITADTANVYASENGEKTLPVSPFILDRESERVSYQNNAWTECEEAKSWHSLSSTDRNAFYDTWTAEKATAEISPEAAFESGAGLKIRGDGRFCVSPVTYTKQDGKKTVFSDMNDDWRNYASLSVMLRNDGDADVTLKSLEIQAAWVFTRLPVVAGTNDTVYVLPADGQWHKVTFDFSKVYAGLPLAGPALDGASSLENITGIKFRFSGKDAQISMDDIRFAPREGDIAGKFAGVKNVLLWLLTPFRTLMRVLTGIFSGGRRPDGC